MSSSARDHEEYPRYGTKAGETGPDIYNHFWFKPPIGSTLSAILINVNRKSRGHLFAKLCRAMLIVLAVAGSYAVGPAEAWDNDPVAHDIAAEIGLNFHGQQLAGTQGQPAVFDYDGDGLRDILLSTHGGSPWPLMHAQPDGTFREILAGTFFKADRMAASPPISAASAAMGGRMACRTYTASPAPAQGTCTKEYPNSLFIQRADHTFQDVARSWGVADVHGRGREPAVIDYDRDGLPDIVVANEGPSRYPAQNRLFHNLGGSFAEVTDSAVRSVLYSTAIAVGDIDGDGWADVVLRRRLDTSLRIVTYHNDAGTFRDVSSTTAYKKRVAEEIDLADVNGDGRLDLLLVELRRFSVWLNVAGTFHGPTSPTRCSRAAISRWATSTRTARPTSTSCRGPTAATRTSC